MGFLEEVENEPQAVQDSAPAALELNNTTQGKAPPNELLTGIRQGWPEGARNTGLTSIAGFLRARGLSGEVIGVLLASVNKSTGMNLPEREILNITRSISRYSPATDEPLPAIEDSIYLAENPPPMKPELISGILRVGHKMSLSGPSKSGKSFALINLALSLAHGTDWLSFPCKQSRVLYMNFEIDRPSCWKRFEIVASARTIAPCHENLKIWNLRSFNAPIEDLIPKLIERIGQNKFDAIIIDPLYKMYQSRQFRNFDENSAANLAYLFCAFDRVIRDCGCALIMAGHYSKGEQGGKNAIDRTSGSGVLGRDPDAILTLTELEKTQGGYRLESVLREFASTMNLSLRWEYPLHVIDSMLDTEGLKGSAGRKRINTGTDLIEAYQSLDSGQGVALQKICENLDCSSSTIKRRIEELDASGLNSLGLYVKGKMVLSKIQNHSE